MSSRAPLFYNALPETFGKARALRRELTAAEKLLWKAIRRNLLEGFYFRRQHPVGPFIADFYCHKGKLVVEVDGETHQSPAEIVYDEDRSAYMLKHGLKVIRFSNADVLCNLDMVLEEITKSLMKGDDRCSV
jgi:very-short-patch-repair endonuclease